MNDDKISPEHFIPKVFEGQFNAQQKELVEKLCFEDVKYHEGDLSIVGKDKLEDITDERRSALTNLRYEIDNIFSSGDNVAVRWHRESPAHRLAGKNGKY